jgi:hypothetical protein
VARSPADGHTILLATLGALVISPMVMRLPIDPARDLVPVSIAVDLFNILTVPAERPWRSAADIIAAAKARPGELSWGHSGIGSAPQLAGLLFAKMAGIETIEVSYRGGSLVATDLISGRLDYGFPTSPSVKTHIEAGRLRGLAVPTLQRSRLLPDIPTVAETGLPGFNVPSWYAVVAPRGTPEPAVQRLAHAMRIALEDKDVIGILNRNGLEASLNLILLLILLGNSPLPLGAVILRYSLTALACLGLSALCASHWGVKRLWSGASGAISALIALAAGLSLLHWRAFSFESVGLEIPAWVLLLVYGALQLGWQLPRQDSQELSSPWQRLLSSSWGWGLLLGLGWALITRIRELL